jgi:molecular chaperone GrpE
MPEHATRESSSQPEDKADPTVLRAENASLQDRVLRALADAENTRRRAERSVAEAGQYAIAAFARELLAVMDNLQRAVAAAPERPSDASLLEGVQATQEMLADVFGRFGVKKIDALGARFDPTLHEAIMEMEDGSHSPGSVGGIVEDGYTIHDRLLRPTRVAVVKGSAKPPQAPADPPSASEGKHQNRSSQGGRGC